MIVLVSVVVGLLCGLALVHFLLQRGISHTLKLALAHLYVWNFQRNSHLPFPYDYKLGRKEKNLEILGIVSHPEAWKKERPRQLKPHIHASDSIAFSGIHQDGSLLMVRITRRQNRMAETWLHLKLPNGDEYQLPNHPDTKNYNVGDQRFSAGGLVLEVLEPLKRWRVTFNGRLRKGVQTEWKNNEDDTVPVNFTFIWHIMYSYVAFPADYKRSFLAHLLAKRNWTTDFCSPNDMFSEEVFELVGSLHGVVQIDNGQELTLYLRGLKERRYGVLNWENVHKKLSIKGILENGTGFHLFAENWEKDNQLCYMYGYIIPPSNLEVFHIDTFSSNPEWLFLYQKCPSNFCLQFTAGRRRYFLRLQSNQDGFVVREGPNWAREISVRAVDVTLNGKPGRGVIEYVYPYEGPLLVPPVQEPSLPLLREPRIASSCDSLVVSFREAQCQNSLMVGGKGASLANMAAISTPHSSKFTVPPGVCITRNAFDDFLMKCPELEGAILQMQDVAWKKMDGDLSAECDKVVRLISDSPIPAKLKTELKLKLTSLVGEEYETMRFAVRSSAIGEDGCEMSAAGQNETFLGIWSFEEICVAVMKCWASQFGYRSVEYKRQNGQLLNAGMGVVIQKMVPSDVAGVLFSRHPLSGAMDTMIISSNFGLGESVVSASVEPDTIALHRSWTDEIWVEKKQIGTKSHGIFMTDDGGGVAERQLPKDEKERSSIADEEAIRLGHIAISLEYHFGSARDIEWALHQGQLFLLQCRPVTTDNCAMDFEILHEFDTSLRTDMECLSAANLQEVLPGAASPLTLSTVLRLIDFVLVDQFGWKPSGHRQDPLIMETISYFLGHWFTNRIQSKTWSFEKEKTSMQKAAEIGVYGKVLEDDEVLRMAIERYENPPSIKSRYGMLLLSLKGMIGGRKLLQGYEKRYRNYSNPIRDITDIHKAYDALGYHLLDEPEVHKMLIMVTMSSSMWNLIILNMLSKGTGEYNLNQYTDFAKIIGSNNGVESGDAPQRLKELAITISQDVRHEEFISWTTKEALEWLTENENTTEAGKKFKDFMTSHGHRALKEFDMMSITWGMEPERVVGVLQEMLKVPTSRQQKKPEDNIKDLLDSLKTPLSPKSLTILSKVIKWSRNGISEREQAKSLLIKFLNGIRLGYRQLAGMMVNQGFIPDAELIFFLTHEEIGRLIRTRSANLLRRAKHRRRLYPKMDEMNFPELSFSIPKPLHSVTDDFSYESIDSVRGYPVCQGIVKGVARVVTSFSEVGTIKAGDILVSHSTDVGWSPYFPLVSGLATEVGGLVSHGAVCAREFGLPCIVGAQNATQIFKSGDYVILDATNGTLAKIL